MFYRSRRSVTIGAAICIDGIGNYSRPQQATQARFWTKSSVWLCKTIVDHAAKIPARYNTNNNKKNPNEQQQKTTTEKRDAIKHAISLKATLNT